MSDEEETRDNEERESGEIRQDEFMGDIPADPPPIEMSSMGNDQPLPLGRRIDGLGGARSPSPMEAQFRILDAEGNPAGSTSLDITVTTAGGETATIRTTAGPTGYATADMSTVDLETAEEVAVEPTGGGEARTIDPEVILDDGLSVVSVDGREDDGGGLPGGNLPGLDGLENQVFTRPPDIQDVLNAPELFNPSVVEENGNCSIDFTAKVDVQENFFNQIVRMTPETDTFEEDEELDQDYITLRGQVKFEMSEDYPYTELDQPSGEPYLERAGRPTLGTLNVYKQSWTRVGHSLGKLLHSLTLAPCESTEVSIIEWSRTERGRRGERTVAREEKSHALHRDRIISDIVEGMIKEKQWGSSTSVQGGVGVSGGIAGFVGEALGAVGLSIGGGAASSVSRSSGRRQLQASTVQSLTDNVVQRASSMRSLRSSVVTQSQEVERDEVRTRAVENHNRNHAMTVQYFQVLEHYNVQTEHVDETDVLLVPYDLPTELWDDVPDFDEFVLTGAEVRRMLAGLPQEVARDVDRYSSGLDATETNTLQADVRNTVESSIVDVVEADSTLFGLEDTEETLAQEAWRSLAINASSRSAAESLDDPFFGGGSDSAYELSNVDEEQFKAVVRAHFEDAIEDVDPRERSALIDWLDRTAEKLREMVPAEHTDAFDALYRLVHTPEVYESARPTVTASNWTVELREAWRPGVTILIHTGDGQTVTLDHNEATEGSAVATFSSPPVDVGAIDSIEINFAPEEATKTVIKSVGKTVDDVGDAFREVGEFFTGQDTAPLTEEVEEARKYDVGRVRVTAHTDPMDALPQSKSYELLDEKNVGLTLSADNPAERWEGIAAPEPDVLETETRRYDDYTAVESLINEIKANRLAYLRRLWLNEDPDRRALRFQRYAYPVRRNGSIDRVPLLDLIENEPLGVVGNSVAFRLLEQGQFDDYEEVADVDLSRKKLVSLPTRGVYAETLLSHCNATEITDVDRIPTARSRCQTEAPEITGVTPGSRTTPQQLQPNVPGSTVGLQQPPEAPEPTGLSSALEVLSSPDVFRDMSLGSETVQAANTLAQKAMEESGNAREQTLKALTSLLGASGGGEGSGEQSAEEAAISAAKEIVRQSRSAAEDRATQAHRQSDPARNALHQQNLDNARDRGAISEPEYQTGSAKLNNAEEDGTVQQVQASGRDDVLPQSEQQRLFLRAREWKQDIIDNALAEEQDWTKPNGSKKDESNMGAKLKDYYGAVGQWAVNQYAAAARQDNEAWSAAFISYVVKQAGVSRSDGFELSVGHDEYITVALQNRKNFGAEGSYWLYNRPFWLYKPDEIEPEPGDILCKNRGSGDPVTYEDFESDFLTKKQGRYVPASGADVETHCDVVVETQEQNGDKYLLTVGGNTYDYQDDRFDTVGRKRWKHTPDGWIMVDGNGNSLQGHTANGVDVWDPSTDAVFAFIRLETWQLINYGSDPA